jgi:methylated-DNA-[protein]-cysteine S-methyltransferase
MSQSIIIETLKTPVGELIAGDFNGMLCLLDWKYRRTRSSIDKRISEGLNAQYKVGNTPIIEHLKIQLSNYFTRNAYEFDLPIQTVGTDFQKTVWNELLKIPYGETRSYLELSQRLGNEKAIRAVASANGANAISIIIPCHRIIGSNGELTGYAGGIPAKKKLLQLESKNIYRQSTLF